jgi:transposase
MLDDSPLDHLSDTEVRALAQRLLAEVRHKQATIDKLTHEMAVLKRLKFAARQERFQGEQRSLLEESLEEDLEAIAEELEQLASPGEKPAAKAKPRRTPLPPGLARREIHHEPQDTQCAVAAAR